MSRGEERQGRVSQSGTTGVEVLSHGERGRDRVSLFTEDLHLSVCSRYCVFPHSPDVSKSTDSPSRGVLHIDGTEPDHTCDEDSVSV